VAATGTAYPQSFPYGPYAAAFGNVHRAPAVPYGPGVVQPADAYPPGFSQSPDYQGIRGRFPSPQSGASQHEQGMSPLTTQGDWVGAFQGLSLNSP